MKYWFIHVRTENKWKKVFRMCLTRAEALYNIELLQKNDKLMGVYNNYRTVCITIKPTTVKQLTLAV